MAKNITRRQAAKAISLGTAAAFVAPAALADADSDAEILALERQLYHIETVILPPLERAFDEAETQANELADPFMKPPRLTLADIENQQAEMLDALKNRKGEAADKLRDVFKASYPGMDYETSVKGMYAHDRKAWQKYADWEAARLQAEKAVDLHEKEQRMYRAHDDADAIREKICSIPARTQAGYLAKLKIAMDGKHPDTIANPEYVTDKALVSLLRDLKAVA